VKRIGVRISRGRAAGIATALAATVLAGCTEGLPGDGKGEATRTAPASDSPASGGGTSPLNNPDGTKPGLAPLSSQTDEAKARDLVEKVSVKGRGPKTGYDRERFGYAWMDTAEGVPLARNGCDTRNDLLARDGRELTYRSGSDCVVVAMRLHDPYTGKDMAWKKAEASKVQIDHVVPLSYAWQMGAARWDDTKRRRLANDPLNLLPVDGPANGAKSDSGPASWLPPNKAVRCSYAVRFAQVAVEYEMPVTTADKDIMLAQCGG